MRKISNILIAAAVTASFASCNKAEFVTSQFVTLNASTLTYSEDDGIVAIPVSVFGIDECTVTYSITDGTAVQGEDFTIVDKDGQPNTTGVVKVAQDKEKNDSIWVKLNYDPTLTRGKTFTVNLLSSATAGVTVSGTKQCSVTINDLEYAVSAYFGSWSGSTDKGDIAFDIKEYDIEKDPDEIAEYYPNCCLVIPYTSSATILGTAIAQWGCIYGYYDAASKSINLYPEQFYVAYNFSGLGPCFLGLENADDYTAEVSLLTGDKTLTFATDVKIGLWYYSTYERSGYHYTKIGKDTVLKKQ